MKLKRILSLALSGVLAVSLMTGCFGAGSKSDAVNRSGDVASALNGAVDAVSFKTNNSDLNKAVITIADTLTAAQAKVNGPVDTGSTIQSTARQITGYDNMTVGEPWSTRTDVGEYNFVRIFVYDAENGAYDTEGAVMDAVASKIKMMNLNNTKDNGTYTNSYKGYVSAYEVEVGTEETRSSVGLLVVSLTQTFTLKVRLSACTRIPLRGEKPPAGATLGAFCCQRGPWKKAPGFKA